MSVELSQFRQFLAYAHPAKGVRRTVVSAFLVEFLGYWLGLFSIPIVIGIESLAKYRH